MTNQQHTQNNQQNYQQQQQQQQQQQHQNSVFCCKCGEKFIVEHNEIALDKAISSGWKYNSNTKNIICIYCLLSIRPLKTPYFDLDTRDGKKIENKFDFCFMDTKNDDGSITVWKLNFSNSVPTWDFYKKIELI